MTSAFIRDRQWFRTTDRLGVLAGSPLTQFTVTPAGSRILDALESGAPLPHGHEPLTDRLLAVGAIHPAAVTPVEAEQITVVVPTRISTATGLERLQRLVDALGQVRVIVVDDASETPVVLTGAQVVRHEHNTGPGGARNTGFGHVTTQYVAFIDDDACIDSSALCMLAGHLEAGRAAMVAPRVRSSSGTGALARYEQCHSPLDMGTHPAVVRPTSRVSYVPSAVIVARVDAMRAAHGFAEAMRIGEDVDFVWRLVESAATVRYVPTIEATHLPRRSPGAFVVQRFRYGTSAAALSRRHGTAASPLRTHVTMLAPLVLAAWGRIDLAAAAVAVMYAWFLFSLRSTRTSLVDRLRIITIGARSTLMSAVRAVSRTWWPIFLALSGVFETIGMAFTVCVVVPAIVDVLRRRPRNPIAHLGFFILDDFSYGAGVWAGALKERSVRCMLPALTVSSRRLRSQG